MKNLKEKQNFKKGITLIALVVTIVVLLILASVSITVVFGDNGILQLAKEAGEKTNEAVKNDQKQIGDIEDYISSYTYEGFNTKKQVNAPKLGNGMVPVKYEEDSWVVTTEDDPAWYNYSDKEIEIDGKKIEPKKWANVMLIDGLKVEGIDDISTSAISDMSGKKVTEVGSMFVWIPRYAYSIAEENYHKDVAGTIAVDFMKGTTNTSVSGRTTWDNASGAGNWNIHPAFEYNGTVTGIWVAKFEASHTGCTTDVSTGQTNTDRADLTIQVKPNVTSWRNISIKNAYEVCLNYNKNLNSHLIKNSEWGAVVYLTQSIYGKNSEIAVNQCSSHITGAGLGIGESNVYNEFYEYDATNFDNTYSYKSIQGKKASTTENIYGIYDMCGGSNEYVAAYINNENDNLLNGKNIVDEKLNYRKDVYNSATTTGEIKQSQDYELSKEKYGDAIYETSSESINSNSKTTWYKEYSIFATGNYPFLFRGGHYSVNRSESETSNRRSILLC